MDWSKKLKALNKDSSDKDLEEYFNHWSDKTPLTLECVNKIVSSSVPPKKKLRMIFKTTYCPSADCIGISCHQCIFGASYGDDLTNKEMHRLVSLAKPYFKYEE